MLFHSEMWQYKFLILVIAASLVRVYLACVIGNSCQNTSSFGFVNHPLLRLVREWSTKKTQSHFSSPHSELLLGVVLGIDELKQNPRFYNALVDTGTIHVVVVSGFNISLVFGIVIKIIGSKYKLKNLVSALFITLFYAILCGFEAPVIRSWVMGCIAAWGRYYGRSLDALLVLIFSGSLMVLFDPAYLLSVSFQLSFFATLSLIMYSGFFASFVKKILPLRLSIFEDLSTTLAAQVLVWPIISYYFGRVSIISPVVNMLTLWTISISTVLGGIFLFCGVLGDFFAWMFSLVVYPFLDVFIRVVMAFSEVSGGFINFKLSTAVLVLYYFIALVFYLKIAQKYANT